MLRHSVKPDCELIDSLQEAQKRTIDPKHAMWTIGPDHIHTGNLRLGALEQVSAGSWQARLFYKCSQ